MTAADLRGAGVADAAAGAPPAGVRVKERVLRRVAEQASASHLGVERAQISAEVAEYREGVAVSLRTPLPVPDLSDAAAVAMATPVLERVETLQEELGLTLERLFGRRVTRLDVTVSGAVVLQRRRVR